MEMDMTSVSCSSWEGTRDSRYDVLASTAFCHQGLSQSRGQKRQKRAQTLFRALSSVISARNDKELTTFTGDPPSIEINTILGGRKERKEQKKVREPRETWPGSSAVESEIREGEIIQI
jgi:hypothetical protein